MKSYWVRFLHWLDGKEGKEEGKIRVTFPKGNTDILLSCNQRRHLENAINDPHQTESSGVYSRETGFWTRGSSGGGGRKEDLIL